MAWLIVFAILFLLAILPLGVSIRYDVKGFCLTVILGPFRLILFPRKKKVTGKNSEKNEKKTRKQKISPKTSEPPKSAGGNVKDFWPLVELGLDFLGELRQKIRVNVLKLRMLLAGGDPSDLAVRYGKAWAAIGNLMPHLDRAFIIKKRDIRVDCNFLEPSTTIMARLDITITFGRILSLGIKYGIKGLKEWIHINNKRKGGAVK